MPKRYELSDADWESRSLIFLLLIVALGAQEPRIA